MGFDCGWSLLNHGVADTKRLNLGNLNPIYERELTKLELHQGEGRWKMCLLLLLNLNKLLPDSSFTSPGTAGNKLLLLLLPSVGLRRRYETELTSFQWAMDERCLRGHEKR